MKKHCLGCGIQLQSTNPNEVGYVKSIDQDYCVSCFRLRHYGDLEKVTLKEVDPFVMLEKISTLDALFVWVVDLFHLEESKIPSLHRWFGDKEVVLLVTKREILPKTMSINKIKNVLNPLIKESHLNIVDVLITGNYGKLNKDVNIKRLDSLRKEFKKEKIVFLGNTNVGKSSFINAISNTNNLSVSVIPGTTLDLIKVDSDIDELYDSAGIAINDSLLTKLDNETIKKLQPSKTIKPLTFQLKGQQSLIIDGFGYLSFSSDKPYSITTYLPDALEIHRTKTENVMAQFERFDSVLADESLKSKNYSLTHNKTDVVIIDLGFVSIHDSQVKVSSHFKESVQLVLRKAVL